MEWPELLKKADKCLTVEEVVALKHQKERYEQVLLGDLFGADKTVQQVIDAERKWPIVSKQAEEIVNESRQLSSSDENPGSAPQKKPGPWVIQESVQFVFPETKNQIANKDRRPDATAFILSVPDRTHTKSLRFLVTARHVVDPAWAHCQKPDPTAIIVRFNKQAGGLAYERIPLKAEGKKLFFVPSDENTDLAIIFLTAKVVPDLLNYKFFDVPFRILTTDPEASVLSTNQPIMTAGLLPDFPGDEMNYPIFKTGVLSSTPDEPIQADCDNPLHPRSIRVWLISAALTPGTSGAPVFTVVSRGPGADHVPVLMGVQSMAWPDKAVAGITPSRQLANLVQEVSKGFDLDLSRGVSH
jgi:hypothetical protein